MIPAVNKTQCYRVCNATRNYEERKAAALARIVNGDWQSFAALDVDLKNDDDLALAAVAQDGRALKFASERIKSDPALQKELFKKSFYCAAYMKNRSAGVDRDYKDLVNKLSDLNINFPERFVQLTPKEIAELISNRTGPVKDSRPIALLVFSEHDQGGAFSVNSRIGELMRKGYKVIYYQVAKDTEVSAAIRHTGGEQKVSLLIVAGHGEAKGIALGNYPSNKKSEREQYDLALTDENKMSGLSVFLEDKAAIVLQSCSTGQGRGEQENMANMFHRLFPQAEIWSPTESVYTGIYSYGPDNRLIGVHYTLESGLPLPAYHIAAGS
jgi:hypothetical protein